MRLEIIEYIEERGKKERVLISKVRMIKVMRKTIKT